MKRIISAVLLVALCLSLYSCNDEEYTITFYNNKGVWVSSSGKMITEYQDNSVYHVEKFSGEHPSEPTPPTNYGYVFLGWYQDPECTEKFLFGHYEVNGNINLYAKWGKAR